MNNLKSPLWWKAALARALRTAIVIALPYFGGASLGAIPWITIASAVGFGFLASLITSVAGIAESGNGQVSWWYAILERVVKTFAQTLVVGLANHALFSDIEWSVLLQTALIASVGSALLAFLIRLPEAELLPSPIQPVADLGKSADIVDTTSGTTIQSDKLAA